MPYLDSVMPKSTIGLLVALCLLVALVVLVVVIYLQKRKAKADIFDEKSGITPIVTTGLLRVLGSKVRSKLYHFFRSGIY